MSEIDTTHRKIVLFAFQGEAMCFAHVLLNALDLNSKGHEARIVIEGMATSLLPGFEKGDVPFTSQFESCRAAGLIAGVCKACANKTGSLESAERQGLKLLDDMSGHPSLELFLHQGYDVYTF